MIGLFGFLIAYLIGWFDLVIDFLQQLFAVIQYISAAVDSVMPLLISFVPDYLISILGVFIVIAMLFKVFGREG